MILYKLEIRKPFDVDIPAEGVKKGDLGIYVKHIRQAIKECATLEITTPFGVTYANPKKVKKDRRIIYRHYLKPEPMLLYLVTPQYGNKEMFEPKEEIKVTTGEVLTSIPEKYRLEIKAKLGLR